TLEFANDRHDLSFYSPMKLFTIFGRVVEAAQPAESVVAIVLKSGIARNLLAELYELLKHVLEIPGFLQTPLGDQFPGFLAQGAIRFFQIAGHLHQGFFLASELDGERTAQFLI